jgi:hypothetical protein
LKNRVIDKSHLFKFKKSINALRSSSVHDSKFDSYLEDYRPTVGEVDLVRDTIGNLLKSLEQAMSEVSKFNDEICCTTVNKVFMVLCERDREDLQDQVKKIESLILTLSKSIGNMCR